MIFLRILFDLCAGKGQQRADQRTVTLPHAGQPDGRRAADQVHQHGFGLIVQVVCSSQHFKTARFPRFPKEIIAHCARGFFDAPALFCRLRRNIEMDDVQRHAPLSAQLLYKPAIPPGTLPADTVLDVCRLHAHAALQQQMQQHHRIHAAGQRAEHALSARASRNLLPHFFVSSRSN